MADVSPRRGKIIHASICPRRAASFSYKGRVVASTYCRCLVHGHRWRCISDIGDIWRRRPHTYCGIASSLRLISVYLPCFDENERPAPEFNQRAPFLRRPAGLMLHATSDSLTMCFGRDAGMASIPGRCAFADQMPFCRYRPMATTTAALFIRLHQ